MVPGLSGFDRALSGVFQRIKPLRKSGICQTLYILLVHYINFRALNLLALSVLIMLVSGNVCHVVLALRHIVCLR